MVRVGQFVRGRRGVPCLILLLVQQHLHDIFDSGNRAVNFGHDFPDGGHLRVLVGDLPVEQLKLLDYVGDILPHLLQIVGDLPGGGELRSE